MSEPESNYQRRQEARDREYKEEYAKWTAGLPPGEREELNRQGLGEPGIDPSGMGLPELDESRVTDAQDWEYIGEMLEPEEVTGESETLVHDAIREMVIELLESRNPNLRIGIAALALRIAPITVKGIAQRHKHSQKAVREEVDAFNERIKDGTPNDRSALKRFVGEVASSKNTALAVDVISLVTGIAYGGESETAIASRHGVSRAAVSRRCVELTERLNLPAARAMKSLESRAVYAAAQEEHWGKSDEMAPVADNQTTNNHE